MAKRKGGLGRGLGALIPTDSPDIPRDHSQEGSGLRMVAVDKISPNPHQPRTEFNQEKLEELAASIQAHGLIQPLIVTEEKNGQFFLIAGERRWRASQLAGLKELPVVVKEATAREMLELAIIENVQRDDLNAVEEALAYRQLIDEFNLTQNDVSISVGKARSTVANLVRLLELPPNVQQAVVDGKISGRHAREMLRLNDTDSIAIILQSVISQNLNVRQTADRIDKLLAGQRGEPIAKKQLKRLPANLNAVKTSFEEKLGTHVDINGDDKKGKIVIHYTSLEELNAIFENIVGEE
ncbi:MAG: ParB/RepB/Spo0J family partition protein [Chloroflexota bacterium]